MILERRGFEGARSEIRLSDSVGIKLGWRVGARDADIPGRQGRRLSLTRFNLSCGMQVPTKVPVKLALRRFKEQVLVVRVKFESDVTVPPPRPLTIGPRMDNVRLMLDIFLPAQR